MLTVDADPLADITSLRKLSLVALQGRVLEARELEKLRGLRAQ